jgi:tagatose 6-phosphate kinase
MIVVVCLNPALDITHHVPVVDWAGVNRPTAVYARPGGKGTNVARALHSFGSGIVLLGLAGGATGRAVDAELRQLGVPTAFTPVAGEARRTFTVVDGEGRAALFNEPGPEVSAAEFARFRLAYGQAVVGAAAVVLSGSLPRGLPVTTYAELIAVAASAGVPVVLDTSGDALHAGVAAGPTIVKPNLDELRALSGWSLSAAGGGVAWAAVQAAADGLRTAGAGAVVVSLGPEGLLAVTADGCWHARPAGPVLGNATGAGDAVTAALVHGLVLGRSWEDQLRHAVALSAASVTAPVAGEFSQADYTGGLGAVAIRQVAVRQQEAC